MVRAPRPAPVVLAGSQCDWLRNERIVHPTAAMLPGGQRLPETALAPRPGTVAINSAEI